MITGIGIDISISASIRIVLDFVLIGAHEVPLFIFLPLCNVVLNEF